MHGNGAKRKRTVLDLFQPGCLKHFAYLSGLGIGGKRLRQVGVSRAVFLQDGAYHGYDMPKIKCEKIAE